MTFPFSWRPVALACMAGASLAGEATAAQSPESAEDDAGRKTRPVAVAQALSPASSPSSSSAALSPVVITGNPLGRQEALQPAEVLTGDALTLRRAGTLGDTLDGLPGVASSTFGPQSARPVIRGLDGDRIRLLDNGGALTDASNLSFDHAVALDPLVTERIEVLRGPAALLYGGNATGGVVNSIDNRVPRTPRESLGGRAELRLGGAASEKAGAAVLEGGTPQGLNWHADVAERRSSDLRVPRFSPVVEGVAQPETTRVVNSAGTSQAGALGASWADAQGHVGAAFDSYRNDYGVTVEPEVTIRLQRERLRLAGERRGLSGPFSQVEFQASRTRYRHEEVEGSGEVGTTFRSLGRDLRVQARHAPLGPLRGVLGLQQEQLDFSALGEEAFVPATRSRSTALFALEELQLGSTTLSAGARWEKSRIASGGDAPDAVDPRFGAPNERRYAPRSFSLGASQPLVPGWTASASLGSTQRAPAYYELFANGVHVATGAYEQGDPALGLERSRHAEVGLKWAQGPHQLKGNVYLTRFANYIALDATGNDIPVTDEDGNPGTVPGYRFSGVPARLYGFELDGHTRVAMPGWALSLTASLDLVRGSHRATGEALPRLAPMRLALGAEAQRGEWRGGALLRHAAAQRHVPATDIATRGHTLLDLWAGWSTRLAGGEALWFAKLHNVGNALAYNAAALRTSRELAPMGGRAVSAGVRVTF